MKLRQQAVFIFNNYSKHMMLQNCHFFCVVRPKSGCDFATRLTLWWEERVQCCKLCFAMSLADNCCLNRGFMSTNCLPHTFFFFPALALPRRASAYYLLIFHPLLCCSLPDPGCLWSRSTWKRYPMLSNWVDEFETLWQCSDDDKKHSKKKLRIKDDAQVVYLLTRF